MQQVCKKPSIYGHEKICSKLTANLICMVKCLLRKYAACLLQWILLCYICCSKLQWLQEACSNVWCKLAVMFAVNLQQYLQQASYFVKGSIWHFDKQCELDSYLWLMNLYSMTWISWDSQHFRTNSCTLFHNFK